MTPRSFVQLSPYGPSDDRLPQALPFPLGFITARSAFYAIFSRLFSWLTYCDGWVLRKAVHGGGSRSFIHGSSIFITHSDQEGRPPIYSCTNRSFVFRRRASACHQAITHRLVFTPFAGHLFFDHELASLILLRRPSRCAVSWFPFSFYFSRSSPLF